MYLRKSESPRRRPIPVRWKSTRPIRYARVCADRWEKAMRPPRLHVRAVRRLTRSRRRLIFPISPAQAMFFPPFASSKHPLPQLLRRSVLRSQRLPSRPSLLRQRRQFPNPRPRRQRPELLCRRRRSGPHLQHRLLQPLQLRSPLRQRRRWRRSRRLRSRPKERPQYRPHSLRQLRFSRPQQLPPNLQRQWFRRARRQRRPA